MSYLTWLTLLRQAIHSIRGSTVVALFSRKKSLAVNKEIHLKTYLKNYSNPFVIKQRGVTSCGAGFSKVIENPYRGYPRYEPKFTEYFFCFREQEGVSIKEEIQEVLP